MLIYVLILDDPEDQESFDKMARTYKGLMFTVARNIVKQDQDAEDAVQKALWAVARNYDTLRGKPEPVVRSYLVTAAENHAKNIYNTKKRRRERSGDSEPTGQVYHYVTDNKLAECILQLPLEYREVVLLKYFHGYTLKEIAKIQGISQSKSEKCHQEAKRILKAMYETEETYEF